MFHGSIVALVTPMDPQGRIDFDSLAKLIDFHLTAGTDGFVILGTTGESATLSSQEQNDVLRFAIKQIAGKKPVIAGTGHISTTETIESTKHAMHLGADACLIVTPYYNKPVQEGLFLHYFEIAKAVPIPIIVYNVPGRTCCDLLPETVQRLAELPNIIGIKEASGKMDRVQRIKELCGDRMDIYCGDDKVNLESMLYGARGAISVTANVAPKLMHDTMAAALAGDFVKAKQLNDKLLPLHEALFLETNPIPTKWLLAQMGLINSGIRLPLTPLASKHHEALRQALFKADITLIS